MSDSGIGNGLKIGLSVFISIVVGVITGLLFGQHCLYARHVSWISCVIGIIILVMIIISTAVDGHRIFHRSMASYLPAAAIGTFGLLASSILKLSLADVHTTLHAVIFGFNTAFLCFVLLIALSFAISIHNYVCRSNC